jgi:hypothetical protein
MKSNSNINLFNSIKKAILDLLSTEKVIVDWDRGKSLALQEDIDRKWVYWDILAQALSGEQNQSCPKPLIQRYWIRSAPSEFRGDRIMVSKSETAN